MQTSESLKRSSPTSSNAIKTLEIRINSAVRVAAVIVEIEIISKIGTTTSVKVEEDNVVDAKMSLSINAITIEITIIISRETTIEIIISNAIITEIIIIINKEIITRTTRSRQTCLFESFL